MPVITKKVPCTIQRRIGSDVYGQPVLSNPVKTTCAVLKFETTRAKTTVRADASGTRGHADEEIADIEILLGKNVKVELGDVLKIQGFESRVTRVRLRFDVMSRLDHIEVGATIE